MELYIDDFLRPGKCLKTYPELAQIFQHPRCHWYAPRPGNTNVYWLQDSVHRLMRRAYPKTPSIVLYNIPNRDNGHYSSGGAGSDEEYLKWIRAFAAGIMPHNNPIIIFEPDALPLAVGEWDKSPSDQLLRRVALFNQALPILQNGGCHLYVDIGHPRWLSPEKAAEVLNMLDPTAFDGFSINVSNFIPTQECLEWGEKVSALVGGKHFVIDTSRNGTTHNSTDWCNPQGKRLGPRPTLQTGHPLCDAFLWVKIPGESDGYCNGGPKAGVFWAHYGRVLLGTDPDDIPDPMTDAEAEQANAPVV